ncbi:hypothetical protein FV139_07135 [Parahaliea maris]|uniref:Uncharacterized protein n=1 Tax=Parahaliea maris TaxID=2716870 RepID=A0A5C9A735_9GAMM|nr:hypothetical protein FV139_07135 [Parahaliea maris]
MTRWLATAVLEPVHYDCIIAVKLKILDGKCKMTALDKVVMVLLYEATRLQPTLLLDADIHDVIDQASQHLQDNKDEAVSEAIRIAVYETRLLAETMISRPVMKRFKRTLREQGLFEAVASGVAGEWPHEHRLMGT